MSETNIQRNDPCSCGSGKKYKHCCAVKPGKSHWMATLSVCLFIVMVGVAIVTVIDASKRERELPEGMVWSEEHGHAHWATGNPHEAPGALPPVGSTWNEEHKHYHGPDGRQIQWSEAQGTWLNADGVPIQ